MIPVEYARRHSILLLLKVLDVSQWDDITREESYGVLFFIHRCYVMIYVNVGEFNKKKMMHNLLSK